MFEEKKALTSPQQSNTTNINRNKIQNFKPGKTNTASTNGNVIHPPQRVSVVPLWPLLSNCNARLLPAVHTIV
ncbi:hypothetical protein CHARACLAT_011425 [Characodon lateralis]|uniref:Uncharacterized protein n=1 Tax=Characodon lateralis TaxID=208331 RepID=A0ABU7CWQ0_9TELE|nr:hypothetical protein [Characodon lateralis]